MKKPVLIALIIIAVILAAGISVLAATSNSAGSSDDPLVSQSYTEGEFSTNLINESMSSASDKLGAVEANALAELSTGSKSNNGKRIVVDIEGSVDFNEGSTFTMVSGKSKIVVEGGSVSDVTSGSEVKSGSIKENHMYIVGTGAKATVSVLDKAAFVAGGDYKVTAGAIGVVAFTDIKADDWFYPYVASAVEMGLVNGVTETTYEPSGTLTLAQAIKLSACMYQRDTEGTVTLENDEDIWYMSYVQYAVSKGIIEGSYASKSVKDYNSAVTREEFVHVFFGALSKDNYKEINSIKDNCIPDVKLKDHYADEIYTFYRAGILTGDENNKFNASSSIKRSEVAAIVARMMDTTLRQSVTLE